MLDILLERPRRVRGHGRGDLDRHVVDVIPGQKGVGTGEAAGGFVLAEHRFTEQIDVELGAVRPQRPDRGAQLGWRGIHDQMPDHPPQHTPGDRHDDTRQKWSEDATETHRGAEVGGQERGYLWREGSQVSRRNPQVFRTDDAIDETDSEVEPLRVLQHSRKALGRGVHRHPGGLFEPTAHQRDGALGELGGEGVFFGRGGGGVSHGNPFAAI